MTQFVANVKEMGTKFWGFLVVIVAVTFLAFTGTFSPEVSTLIGTVTGAFFGFQAKRDVNGAEPKADPSKPTP
jgi:hypothetical protein